MKLNFYYPGKDKGYLLEKYQKLYGQGDYINAVKDHQKRMKRRTLALIAFFLLLLIYGIFFYRDSLTGVVKEDGYLQSFVRSNPDEFQTIDTTVLVVGEKGVLESEKSIRFSPEGNEENAEIFGKETKENQIDRELDSLIGQLERSNPHEKIILPTQLEDGTPIFWKEKKNNPIGITMIGLLMTFSLLYFFRFDYIKKQEKQARESIIRELPEFINKLVLLLNAGMMVDTAMEKIIVDHQENGKKRNNYFYQQMGEILDKMKKSNASLRHEFIGFAKRSQVHPLIRIANTISDNIEKGSRLGEKLQRENEALWYARKKQSEEKGRVAESKLTIPLMILLLVLVMITIAPAMLTM